MSSELLIVLKALDQASKPIGDVGNSLGGVNTKSQSLISQGLNPVQSILSTGLKVAAGAAVGAVAGLTAAIVSGVGEAASLEQVLADTAAVMGLTTEEVAPLKKEIMDLSLDPRLKVSTEEAGSAINMLAKNGLSMTEILDGAAKSTVLLANATDADFSVAADIATDVMKQFNIEVADMDQAVNGIASVTSSSKFDINDYAMAIAQAGGIASSVGVGFSDFNTTISAISPLFASGSDAGTSFKTFLQRLIPTTSDAEGAMHDLGLMSFNTEKAFNDLAAQGITPASDGIADVSMALHRAHDAMYDMDSTTEEGAEHFQKWSTEMGYFNSAFFDANGELKSMAEISGALHEATKDLSDAQLNEAMSTMFGTDAMRAALGVAGYTEEEFRALSATMNETDATEMAATRMNTLQGAMEILQGVIGGITLSIGDAFLPVVRQMVTILTDFVDKHGQDIINFFTKFAENIAALIQWVIAVVDDGDTMNDWLTHMSPLLRNVVEGSTPVINALKTMWENVNALSQYIKIVVTDGDTMNDWLTHMSPSLRGIVEVTVDVIQWFGSLWNLLKDLLAPVISLIDYFVNWSDVGYALAIMIGAVVVSAIASLVAAIYPFIALITSITTAIAVMRTAWENDFLGIQTFVLNVWETVSGYLDSFVETWKTFGDGAIAEIVAFVTGSDTEFTNLKGLVTGALEIARQAFTDLVGWVSEKLPEWIGILSGWAFAAWDWIVTTAIPNTISAITEWGGKLIQFLTDNLPIWVEKLGKWASIAWTWIRDTAIPNVITYIGNFGNTLINYLTNNLPIWTEKLGLWASNAWTWIRDTAIPNTVTYIGKLGSTLIDYLKDNLPIWIEKLGLWASNAWTWIRDTAIPNIITYVGKLGNTLFDYLKDNLPIWIENLSKWASSAWIWIRDTAIPNMLTAITEWSGKLIQYLIDKLPEFIATLLQWATKIVSWIAEALPGAITALSNFVIGIIEWITGKGTTDLTESTSSWVDSLMKWINDDLMPIIGPELEKLIPVLKTAVTNIGTALWEAAKAIGKAFIDGMFNVFGTNYEALTTKVDEIKTAIVNRVGTWVTNLTDAGKKTLTYLKDGINNVVNDPIGAANSAMDGLITAFNNKISGTTGLQQHLWTLGRDALVRLKDGINNAYDDPIGTANSAMDGLIGAFNSKITSSTGLQQHLWTLGRDTLVKLKDGLNAAYTDPIGAAENAASNIIGVFNQWFSMDHFKSLGENVMKGLMAGINELYDEVMQVAEDIGQDIQNLWDWMWGVSSPSKWSAGLMRNVMKGMVVGTDDESKNVLQNVKGFGTSMQNTFDRFVQPVINYQNSVSSEGMNSGNQSVINNQQRSYNTTFNIPPNTTGGSQNTSEVERIRLLNTLYGGSKA